MTVLYLAIFGIAAVGSFVLTRLVRDAATARGWVSGPGSERNLHTRPLPRLGGVALALAFFSATLVLLIVGRFGGSTKLGFSLRPALPILLGSVVILLLGVYDDLRGTGPYTKIVVQSLAGLILFAGNLRFAHLGLLFGSRELAWFVTLPLTLFWVLAITNAFNLIDGVDGLAAGSALFSTVSAFVVALVIHAPLASLMTLALSGAILGFLHYNFNPATIFLGDSGSLFIGFMLSALALQSAEKAPTMLAVAIPVVSFGLPILETVLSVLRRWIAGRPVFSADKGHIHHKLLARGFSQRQVVIILYGVSAIFGLLSLFLLWPAGGTIGLVFVVLGAGVWIGVQHLGYLEFGELRRVAQRTIEQRKIFVNNLALRQAIEELKQVDDRDHLYRVLISAFSDNDFDGFELHLHSAFEDFIEGQQLDSVSGGEDGTFIRWTKPEGLLPGTSWSISLDIVGKEAQDRASMVIYRHYDQSALQFDVNLLISEFPDVLATALWRTRMKAQRISRRVLENVEAVETFVAEAS